MSKIKFTAGGEELTLIVQSCFSYTYNAMKTVLKIAINEADHSYAEIEKLKKNIGKIGFYEEDDLKTTYSGYNLGESGFTCNYANGVFNVELTQEGSYGLRLDKVEDAIDEILMMLCESEMSDEEITE